jgi:hypothetical protein
MTRPGHTFHFPRKQNVPSGKLAKNPMKTMGHFRPDKVDSRAMSGSWGYSDCYPGLATVKRMARAPSIFRRQDVTRALRCAPAFRPYLKKYCQQ